MTDFVQSGPDAGLPIGTPFPEEIGKVLANFYVTSVTKRPNNVSAVSLSAVTKGPNNWSQWSPAGTIELTTVNAKATAWFEERIGKDVRITFDDLPE